MPPLRPAAPSVTFLRSFSSTSHCAAKSSAKRLAYEHSAVPPYPYGPSKWYKQSNFGLYGLQKIRFGNMVSEKNEIKTRRYWRPNVLRKRLWSQSLRTYLRIRVTARVLRTIDKCGGLDEYLLGEKAGRIKELGMGGWKLRWRIMQTESVKERFRKQREALGLPPKEDVAIGSDGMVVTKEMVAEEIQKYDDELAKEADVEIGDEVEGIVEGGNFMEEKAVMKDKIVL
jgi:large subunit ribosomal protein L28